MKDIFLSRPFSSTIIKVTLCSTGTCYIAQNDILSKTIIRKTDSTIKNNKYDQQNGSIDKSEKNETVVSWI